METEEKQVLFQEPEVDIIRYEPADILTGSLDELENDPTTEEIEMTEDTGDN